VDYSKNLFAAEYLTRVRAFVELTWLEKREELLPVLRTIALTEQAEEWRLRALEVLVIWRATSELAFIESLYNDRDPLVVRGAMWCVVTLGEVEDITRLLSFAASPKGRIIRPETVYELLIQAMQNKNITKNEIFIAKNSNKEIYRYAADWDFEDDETQRLLTIYPSADYFALRCREQGIAFKEYKKINYRD
jgi:hypothetical protein